MRVRVTTEFEINSLAWVRAAEVAEHLTKGQLDPTDHDRVASEALGYCDAEDNLPCWARDSVEVVYIDTKIIHETEVEYG